MVEIPVILMFCSYHCFFCFLSDVNYHLGNTSYLLEGTHIDNHVLPGIAIPGFLRVGCLFVVNLCWGNAHAGVLRHILELGQGFFVHFPFQYNMLLCHIQHVMKLEYGVHTIIGQYASTYSVNDANLLHRLTFIAIPQLAEHPQIMYPPAPTISSQHINTPDLISNHLIIHSDCHDHPPGVIIWQAPPPLLNFPIILQDASPSPHHNLP
jgi:hypothetical protein